MKENLQSVLNEYKMGALVEMKVPNLSFGVANPRVTGKICNVFDVLNTPFYTEQDMFVLIHRYSQEICQTQPNLFHAHPKL